MAKIDDFKAFVQKNPELLNHVKNNKMTWQKFYEIYDLYGEDRNAWKDYLTVPAAITAVSGVGELFNFFKKIDLDSLQNGVSSLQRVLGVVQDFTGPKENTKKEEYKPRPLYKNFED